METNNVHYCFQGVHYVEDKRFWGEAMIYSRKRTVEDTVPLYVEFGVSSYILL